MSEPIGHPDTQVAAGEGGDVLEEGGVFAGFLVGQVARLGEQGDVLLDEGAHGQRGVEQGIVVGRQFEFVGDAVLLAHVPHLGAGVEAGGGPGQAAGDGIGRDARGRTEIGLGVNVVGRPFQRQLAIAVLPKGVGALQLEAVEFRIGLDEAVDGEDLVLFLEQELFAGRALVDEAVVPGMIDVQVAREPAAGRSGRCPPAW